MLIDNVLSGDSISVKSGGQKASRAKAENRNSASVKEESTPVIKRSKDHSTDNRS